MSTPFDAGGLAAVAARIDAQATALRAQLPRLSATFAAVRWTGPASRAYHGAAREVLAVLLASADRLEIAADALRVHADHVRLGRSPGAH
ncbi:hypothetical protein [uncultured Jatrophihabitans sp.]|uniref:hypothetical protein n=1 Tax=uncultured Jatrophihabitans sp. TaxID=1610747 RepID=UPI0035C9C1F6